MSPKFWRGVRNALLIELLLVLIIASACSLLGHASTDNWQATSYCKGQVTASGLRVRRGIAASDPAVLPLGSIVRVTGTGDERWDGLYSVQDTGPAVQGQHLDLYFWSCYEALEFGRREVDVEVLRRGFDPNGLGLR